MPPAGLNLQLQVIRITDQADDSIGGAQPSGTVIYPIAYGRFQARKPTQAILEQGLVAIAIFTAVISPGNMDIHFNDQILVTGPTQSPYYNERFVVIGRQGSGMTDIRRFIILTLRRVEQANAPLLQ